MTTSCCIGAWWLTGTRDGSNNRCDARRRNSCAGSEVAQHRNPLDGEIIHLRLSAHNLFERADDFDPHGITASGNASQFGLNSYRYRGVGQVVATAPDCLDERGFEVGSDARSIARERVAYKEGIEVCRRISK